MLLISLVIGCHFLVHQYRSILHPSLFLNIPFPTLVLFSHLMVFYLLLRFPSCCFHHILLHFHYCCLHFVHCSLLHYYFLLYFFVLHLLVDLFLLFILFLFFLFFRSYHPFNHLLILML